MGNIFLIWALATLPSFGLAMCLFGGILMAASTMAFLVSLDTCMEVTKKLQKVIIVTAPMGFILFFIGFLVPTQDHVIKAYLMVEGSKVITADNAEKTSKEIVERVDILMEAFLPEKKQKSENNSGELDAETIKNIIRLVNESNRNQ